MPLGDELTFGRQADLYIDDNRHLHRVLGRFWSRGDAWWLTNEGRSITIQIADADSRSSVTLAPGSEIAMSFPNSILRFRAGVTDYEVVVAVPDRGAGEGDDEDDPLDADADELETIALGDLLLTDEQRLLLLALGEGALLDPHDADDLPTNRAVARRLGWSITKFNRKLDNLCNRFAKLGVGGLRGSIDQLATDRRRRLVEHAIESGLISRSQLDRAATGTGLTHGAPDCGGDWSPLPVGRGGSRLQRRCPPSKWRRATGGWHAVRERSCGVRIRRDRTPCWRPSSTLRMPSPPGPPSRTRWSGRRSTCRHSPS